MNNKEIRIRVYAYSHIVYADCNTHIRVLSYAYARIDCVCEVRLFLSGTVIFIYKFVLERCSKFLASTSSSFLSLAFEFDI